MAAWEAMCERWLSEDGSLYQRTDVAPPPCKDFIQIYITTSEIIFRKWRIIPPTRADANQYPSEMRCSYTDFLDDERMRGEISRTLGPRELKYVDNLIGGHIDYLNRLPKKVMLRIMFHLDLTSISRLSQVNKTFQEHGKSDALWSKIYLAHTDQPITYDLLMLTDQKGWKEVFFMNKLQLQVLLHRQEERDKREKSEVFLTS